MIEFNLSSLFFLISSFVVFTLFFALVQTKSKSKARKSYNSFILLVGFWLLSDAIEYSATDIFTAHAAMLFSYFLISFSLFFLTKFIFELGGKENKWISLIPLFFFILFAPSFQVGKGVYTPFTDVMNLPLLIFNFLLIAFFLFLIWLLFSIKNSIKNKKAKKKLNYFSYIILFIVLLNFFYYLVASFYNLPSLTWLSGILFALLTYPLFK